jgi:hypothetical protein
MSERSWTPEELEVYYSSALPRIKQKNHKYHAAPIPDRTHDGIIFGSRKEMEVYQKLKLLEAAGKIWNLELQPKFVLQPAFEKGGKHYREITYIADFAYTERAEDGTERKRLVDVKGLKLPVYRLKRKLLEYTHKDLDLEEW